MNLAGLVGDKGDKTDSMHCGWCRLRHGSQLLDLIKTDSVEN